LTPGQLADKREEALELMARLSALAAWCEVRGVVDAEEALDRAAHCAATAAQALRRVTP